jgi:hypothetical protein
MRRASLRHSLVLSALAGLLLAAPALAASVVQVRVGNHPTFTRVVFELDAPSGYRIVKHADGGAQELIITLDASSTPRSVRSGSPEVGLVAVQQGARQTEAHIRLRNANAGVKEMILNDPPRIVIDVLREPSRIAAEKAAAQKRAAAKAAKATPAAKPAEAKVAETAPVVKPTQTAATPGSGAKAAEAKAAAQKAADAKAAEARAAETKAAEAKAAAQKAAEAKLAEAKAAEAKAAEAKAAEAKLAEAKAAEAKAAAQRAAEAKAAEEKLAQAKAAEAKAAEEKRLADAKAAEAKLAEAKAAEAKTAAQRAAEAKAAEEKRLADAKAAEAKAAEEKRLADSKAAEAKLAEAKAAEARTAPSDVPPAPPPVLAGEPPTPVPAPAEIAKASPPVMPAPVPTPAPAAATKPRPATPAKAEPAGELRIFGLEPLQVAALAGGVLLLFLLVVMLMRRRRLPNDLDVTALAEEDAEPSLTDGLDFGAGERESAPAPPRGSADLPMPAPARGSADLPMPARGATERPTPAPAPTPPIAAPGGLFGDTDQDLFDTPEKGETKMNQDSLDLPVSRGQRPTPAPTMATSAAGDSDVTRLVRELERRLAQVETRLDEANDARERLERQVAAQSEELRVQRAAIARTQRALRGLNRGEEEQATEPALRDPGKTLGGN